MTRDRHDDVVRAQFSPRAGDYLTSVVHAQGADLDRMETLAAQRAPGLALDLGAGGGHVSYRLAAQGHAVTACDLSAAMLETITAEATRRGLHTIRTAVGAAEALPFADGAFDLVATRFSAHHWRDLAKGLFEVRRVLKPSGVFLALDVVSAEDPLFDTWLQTFELLRDPSHVRDYAPSEWRGGLEAAGFCVSAHETFRLRLEFASWIARMRTPPRQVEALEALRRAAGHEVRQAMAMEEDGSFTVTAALFVAWPTTGSGGLALSPGP